jgi:16S rRNA (cytosine1402-N4)-methyltransferase
VEDLASALKLNADIARPVSLAKKIKLKVNSTEGEILASHLREVVPHMLLAQVFQAIRMEVNQELQEIETSLKAAVECLAKGGRLAVMSYHSVEDRCVKNTLGAFENSCICPPHLPICACGGNHQKLKKIIKKPIVPSVQEIRRNPRARSAKLRVMERL